MTHGNVPSKCRRTKLQPGGKMCVSFDQICVGVTLEGPDHVASCHSKFSKQFPRSKVHGGFAEEPRLMYSSRGDFQNELYSILPWQLFQSFNNDCCGLVNHTWHGQFLGFQCILFK